MSVLLPWDRKAKAKPRRVNGPPVPRRSLLPTGERAVIVAAVAVALVLALAVISVAEYLPARLPVIWERPGAVLASACSGNYLLKEPDSFSLAGDSGEPLEIGPLPGEPLLAGETVVTVDEDHLMSLAASGATAQVAGTYAGETVCGSLADGTILTARPSQSMKFGETWTLRALDPRGPTLWDQELPGPPLLFTEADGLLIAGTTDLSSGGVPVVACLARQTGEVLWAKVLQPGLWRAIGALNGGVAAVLDSGISVLAESGSLAWTFLPDHPVITAAVIDQTVVIATGSSLRGLARYLYPYAVTAVAAPGKAIWQARMNQIPLSIVKWGEGGASGGRVAVALGETHVIGFSLRDGERLFGVRTGSRPVRLEGDCLLIQDRSGLRLVSFRQVAQGMRAMTP